MQITERKLDKEIIYPVSDGEPVAETYDHFYALLVTLEVLKQYLTGQQATVLGNQFLYYAKGFPKLRVAPDVMVIFDVEPGGRDSFKTWEEQAVPQVVFEMTSKSTKKEDQEKKFQLYEQIGVTEYWLFDPRGEWLESPLMGYQLVDEMYQPILNLRSNVLGLQLAVENKLIQFTEVATGNRLLHPSELKTTLEQMELKAEQEKQRAAQEKQRAAQEKQRAEKLIAQLKALGVDPVDE
ncbi:MAG: Uma2 family endonuclease [Cyanobacteria bacterium P01_F01_bin.42]